MDRIALATCGKLDEATGVWQRRDLTVREVDQIAFQLHCGDQATHQCCPSFHGTKAGIANLD